MSVAVGGRDGLARAGVGRMPTLIFACIIASEIERRAAPRRGVTGLLLNPVEVVLTLVGRGDTGEVVRADVLWEDAVVAGLAQAPTHMANH